MGHHKARYEDGILRLVVSLVDHMEPWTSTKRAWRVTWLERRGSMGRGGVGWHEVYTALWPADRGDTTQLVVSPMDCLESQMVFMLPC